MLQQEVRKLVDTGALLDKEIKGLTKELGVIKDTLKKIAREKFVKVLNGNIYSVSFIDENKMYIDIDNLHELIDEWSRLKKMLKVGITDAKKELSEVELDSVSTIETVEFAKMKFSK